MSKSWGRTRSVELPGNKPVIGSYTGGIFQALSEVLIPDGGRIPIAVADTDAYVFFARYLRDQGSGARLGIKALLVIFDLLPALFIGRLSRFVNLAPQEKDLYLMDWYASRIYYRRMILVLLKTLVGMGYYNDPAVLKAMDFEFPCEDGGQQ